MGGEGGGGSWNGTGLEWDGGIYKYTSINSKISEIQIRIIRTLLNSNKVSLRILPIIALSNSNLI